MFLVDKRMLQVFLNVFVRFFFFKSTILRVFHLEYPVLIYFNKISIEFSYILYPNTVFIFGTRGPLNRQTGTVWTLRADNFSNANILARDFRGRVTHTRVSRSHRVRDDANNVNNRYRRPQADVVREMRPLAIHIIYCDCCNERAEIAKIDRTRSVSMQIAPAVGVASSATWKIMPFLSVVRATRAAGTRSAVIIAFRATGKRRKKQRARAKRILMYTAHGDH